MVYIWTAGREITWEINIKYRGAKCFFLFFDNHLHTHPDFGLQIECLPTLLHVDIFKSSGKHRRR